VAGSAEDDPLLWRLRRSIERAQRLDPQADNYREALVLTAEISAHVRSLVASMSRIEDEMKTASRRTVAVNAYNRCAALGPRKPVVSSEGTKS
jgi:hypothetical protein